MKRREGRQKCCLLFMLFFYMFLTFCTLRCCLRCECDDVCTLASTHTQRYKWHPWSNLYHIRYHHFLFWICGVERDGNGLGWWALPASIHILYLIYIYMWTTYPFVAGERRSLYLSIYALVPFAVVAPVSTLAHSHELTCMEIICMRIVDTWTLCLFGTRHISYHLVWR